MPTVSGYAIISYSFGLKIDVEFTLRSVMEYKPFTTLILLIFVITFTVSYILKIFEGLAYSEMDIRNDFRLLENCVWFVFVTMTTVGYGDITPTTVVGRLVAILTSFIGIVLVAIIILNLQKKFMLNDTEFTVFG